MLAEKRLETDNQVGDVLERLNERWENRLTLSNPRLIEHYVEGELHLLVLFEEATRHRKQFVALIERALPVVRNDVQVNPADVGVGVNTESPLFRHRCEHHALEDCRNGEVCELCADGYQESVLIDVVKLAEFPERVVPSLVRFGLVDSIYGRLRHALYFSSTRGFVFRGAVGIDNGETDALALAVGERSGKIDLPNVHKMPSEVVEGASDVLNGVASDQCNFDGHDSGASEVIHRGQHIGKLRIWLGADFIRLGVQEGLDFPLQIKDVLFGPFDFF